jgi:Tol biopolymer transport system component
METRGFRIVAPWLVAALGAPAFAQFTQRVSTASDGTQGNGHSEAAFLSADGRFVAFHSGATNLVPGDTNGAWDVFVRDLWTGITERVSLASDGSQGEADSWVGSISGNGRFVAFQSDAPNLVPGDTNGRPDAFVRDRRTGTTQRVSVASGGAQATGDSGAPAISADGRYVVFQSNASDLVAGDTNGHWDVFVHDLQTGTTVRVSVDSTGAQANSASTAPSISGDGRTVAFWSAATNLVPGDTNGRDDAFVRDLQAATTERVSVAAGGVQVSTHQFAGPPSSLSPDGRFVAFRSAASDLVPGDTNEFDDVFVRDRVGGTTERASVSSSGAQGNSNSENPSISADGRYVAFWSPSTNLVPGDVAGYTDIFVRDRQRGLTERVSVTSSGAHADGTSFSSGASISADGRWVAFWSGASNLGAGDTNQFADVFVRDRDARGFTSLCDPGVGGVIGCPCSNPPSGPDRGCDNSSASGGARLSASGAAYLSLDSLVFTTSGEPTSAASILLQGSSPSASGLVYGQGVRCLGGTLRPMYVKTAQGGSITAPDFVVGDPYIPERSAALGDPIQAGQSRWYFVYYRDPVVLGGCPATSTFNATQTGRIRWEF